jgi:hypothetical protein
MLCSSAARLAQSKGMHLQPLDSWELEPDDILNRNWLFWTIYCYEKHIASRSGRPSVSRYFCTRLIWNELKLLLGN